MGLGLLTLPHVLNLLLQSVNALQAPSRLCEIFLQHWITICLLLVLATCLLLTVWTPATNKLRCFRLFSKPYPPSSHNDHIAPRRLGFCFPNLLRKRSASLEAFKPPSSLTESQTRNFGLRIPMSQTLTAIAHPLTSRIVPPVHPQTWQRDFPPYRRQRGSTPQVWYPDAWIQNPDQDFPPLKSLNQAFPSLKQQQAYQASLLPKGRQWDRTQGFRMKNKYRKPKYKPLAPLIIPTIPDKPLDTRVKQPYEAFLVLDIEGTCQLGTDFNYPNEIIEFPVCLLQWADRSDEGLASELKIIDEFRSFVKPTWRPVLSDFCKELTGITQDTVDSAPHFSEVLTQLEGFLIKNGLIDAESKKRLKKFCWCSDGPCDIRDFVVKQCFISKVKMPSWLESDVLDVRSTVIQYLSQESTDSTPGIPLTSRSLNIPNQLRVLGLPVFQGREHSGIDDTRNITKVLIELARLGMCLLPNSTVRPNKRWAWMGKEGQILEEAIKA